MATQRPQTVWAAQAPVARSAWHIRRHPPGNSSGHCHVLLVSVAAAVPAQDFVSHPRACRPIRPCRQKGANALPAAMNSPTTSPTRGPAMSS